MDLYVGRLHVRWHWGVWLVRYDHWWSEPNHEPLGTENDTDGPVHAVELDFWRLLRFARATRSAGVNLVSWQHWWRWNVGWFRSSLFALCRALGPSCVDLWVRLVTSPGSVLCSTVEFYCTRSATESARRRRRLGRSRQVSTQTLSDWCTVQSHSPSKTKSPRERGHSLTGGAGTARRGGVVVPAGGLWSVFVVVDWRRVFLTQLGVLVVRRRRFYILEYIQSWLGDLTL